MKRKYIKNYLVSYVYETEEGNGHGSTALRVKGNSTPLIPIWKIKELIKESHPTFINVVPLSISEVSLKQRIP